jgi:hypothetical protein
MDGCDVDRDLDPQVLNLLSRDMDRAGGAAFGGVFEEVARKVAGGALEQAAMRSPEAEANRVMRHCPPVRVAWPIVDPLFLVVIELRPPCVWLEGVPILATIWILLEASILEALVLHLLRDEGVVPDDLLVVVLLVMRRALVLLSILVPHPGYGSHDFVAHPVRVLLLYPQDNVGVQRSTALMLIPDEVVQDLAINLLPAQDMVFEMHPMTLMPQATTECGDVIPPGATAFSITRFHDGLKNIDLLKTSSAGLFLVCHKGEKEGGLSVLP